LPFNAALGSKDIEMDAHKLLMKSYWGSSGWKSPEFSEAEENILINANLSKPATSMTHDEAVSWALEVCNKVSKESVANAFLSSLSTRQLEYRSPLGSFAHLHHMKDHKFERADKFHTAFCKTCGFSGEKEIDVDFSVLSFEKYKWGGVRHDDIIYMAYDLEQFLEMDTVIPAEEDYKIFISILKAAVESKNFTTLKKNISKLFKSNDSERGQLCEILGYSGVLQPKDCPSYINSFVDWNKRGDGKPRSDMRFPLGWWEGNHYLDEAIDYWFPEIREYT